MRKNNTTKITLPNTLHDLLSAVTLHDDCPEWLVDAIWDAVNDQGPTITCSSLYWAAMLEAARPKSEEGTQENVLQFRQEVAR